MNGIFGAALRLLTFGGLGSSAWTKRGGPEWSVVGGAHPTTAGEPVSEETALNYSAVWCATRLLCGTGASLPFPLYRGLDDERREKARTHSVHFILNRRFNPEMTAYAGRSLMWQHQVNWGNAYAEIGWEGERPDGKIAGLWPLHPSWVTPLEDDDGDLFYRVREPGTGVRDLYPWQVLHIPSILTTDGICGRGVIAHARESIGAGLATEKYGAHWFGGAAVPRVVIEHSGKWEDAQRKAFRQEWDDMHAGPDGHRVAVLGGGAKAVPLSLSAEDSQFLETRQFNIEEIARWYGIPPHMLQHLLRATFNNVEELGINFVQYSLIPWLCLWEQAVWQKLLTPSEQAEYFVEHNVNALQRGNAAARAGFYNSMVASGLMSRNEARKLENLDPVPGGDTFLVQGGMFAIGQDGVPVAPSSQAAEVSDDSAEDDEADAAVEAAEEIKATVAKFGVRARRIVERDLSRLLTKESKRILHYAGNASAFVQRVDAFYRDEQSQHISEALSEPLAALADCGCNVDAEQFVAAWVREGKNCILMAAGSATADELPVAVQRVLESRQWTERPRRAIEGVLNAVSM